MQHNNQVTLRSQYNDNTSADGHKKHNINSITIVLAPI